MENENIMEGTTSLEQPLAKHEHQSPAKIIDIREVIRSKSPMLLKLLPGFVISYIRKIIHEDEFNEFLYKTRNKVGLDFVEEMIRFFNVNIVVNYLEKIPPEGSVTLVSNHPLGGLDGVAIVHTIGRVRKDIVTPVNDLLMFVPNGRVFFVPVNKHGTNADNITLIRDAFKAENIMMLFPAGLCSRKQNGVICDLEWKTTFIVQSKRCKRVVLPIHFSGRNSRFFYNLSSFRKFLGIKANLEMFFLVNEMFKQHDKTFTITIGDPIPYETFDQSKNPTEWARWVKDKVYALGEKMK